MSAENRPARADAAPRTPGFESFDHGFALRQCNGNESIVIRLVTRFARELGENRRALDERISGGHAEEAAALAHKIKGSSAALGAGSIRGRAERIESLCRASRLGEAATELRAFEGDITSFQADATALERSSSLSPDGNDR